MKFGIGEPPLLKRSGPGFLIHRRQWLVGPGESPKQLYAIPDVEALLLWLRDPLQASPPFSRTIPASPCWWLTLPETRSLHAAAIALGQRLLPRPRLGVIPSVPNQVKTCAVKELPGRAPDRPGLGAGDLHRLHRQILDRGSHLLAGSGGLRATNTSRPRPSA